MNQASPEIRRSARRLRIVTLGATLLFELVVLAAIASLLSGPASELGLVRVEARGLPPWPTAALLLLIGLLAGLALLALARMLARVEAGAPFAAAADLRAFARYIFLSLLASIFGPPAIQLAMIAVAGGGGRVEFALAQGEALMLLVTGLLFFVARLLDEAQAVADDASQIV